MPLATKAIKQKISSTSNIRKITKTMEMVSVSKMRKAVDKAVSSRAYSLYAFELLVNFSKSVDINHRLMQRGKNDSELFVIITSNKGLCGGYHTNIFKSISSYLANNGNKNKDIKSITVGKYAEKISKKLGIKNFASFTDFSENSSMEQIQNLSRLITKEYVEGEYKSVKILYTEFKKSTLYKPVLREIFPISVSSFKNLVEELGEKENEEIKNEDLSNYIFEPSVNDILDSILPRLVDALMYQILAESYASEHSARMFAMKNAGDNAKTILDSLVLSYNNARQGGITRELSEIVSGAEALNVD